MVVLGELAGGECEALVAASVASFLDELVAGGIDRDTARAATDAWLQRLLPDGVVSDGHRFRSIEHDGRRVGQVWFGPMPDAPGDCYLFEIEIDDDERRHGLGTAALQAVIAELGSLPVDRLGLNVFETNTAAIALYESLGFELESVSEGGCEMWLHL